MIPRLSLEQRGPPGWSVSRHILRIVSHLARQTPLECGALQTPSLMSDKARQESHASWLRDLRALRRDAKARFADVTWDDGAGGLIHAHKSIVYSRAAGELNPAVNARGSAADNKRRAGRFLPATISRCTYLRGA